MEGGCNWTSGNIGVTGSYVEPEKERTVSGDKL